MRDDEPLNALTGAIVGAAIEVHRALGPGLLESALSVGKAFNTEDAEDAEETQREDREEK